MDDKLSILFFYNTITVIITIIISFNILVLVEWLIFLSKASMILILRYLIQWLNIGHSKSQCSNEWLQELQQGYVSGQVLLTMLADFATILSNLYLHSNFNNQLNP